MGTEVSDPKCSLEIRSHRVVSSMAILICVLITLICPSSPAAGENELPSAQAPVHCKDVFPVGLWLDGRVEGINCPEGFHDVPNDTDEARTYYDRVFTDMVKRGFNIVVIPNTPPDYREILLTSADAAGIRVVLELAEAAWPGFGGEYSIRHPEMITGEAKLRTYYEKIIPPLAKHPSLFAYQIIDEPQGVLFTRFGILTRLIADLDPAHPAFSCLCNESELGDAYKMGTEMLIFDRYPFNDSVAPGTLNFSSQISLLDLIRTTASEAGIPFWNVVQACGSNAGLRYPTDAELQANIYLSLACNAKGIFMFLYNSHSQQEKLEGLMDTNLSPRPLFAEATRLAKELNELSPLLLTLKPANSNVAVAKPVLGRAFQDPKGNTYVILVNLDTANGCEALITIPTELAAGEVTLRDVLRDEDASSKASDDEGAHQYAIPLDPGQGRVLKAGPKEGLS